MTATEHQDIAEQNIQMTLSSAFYTCNNKDSIHSNGQSDRDKRVSEAIQRDLDQLIFEHDAKRDLMPYSSSGISISCDDEPSIFNSGSFLYCSYKHRLDACGMGFHFQDHHGSVFC